MTIAPFDRYLTLISDYLPNLTIMYKSFKQIRKVFVCLNIFKKQVKSNIEPAHRLFRFIVIKNHVHIVTRPYRRTLSTLHKAWSLLLLLGPRHTKPLICPLVDFLDWFRVPVLFQQTKSFASLSIISVKKSDFYLPRMKWHIIQLLEPSLRNFNEVFLLFTMFSRMPLPLGKLD